MARTTIHLMRHGEVHNPGGILYGRLPGYHLSTLGHQMAQQVADVLSASGHDITRVITSPLERARETGAPTAAALWPGADDGRPDSSRPATPSRAWPSTATAGS